MKTALKVVGWAVVALIVLIVFLQADKLTQWGVGTIAVAVWLIHELEKTVKKLHEQQAADLERIEQKLDQLLNHPLNTRYICDGIEAMVDECNARNRGDDGGGLVAALSRSRAVRGGR